MTRPASAEPSSCVAQAASESTRSEAPGPQSRRRARSDAWPGAPPPSRPSPPSRASSGGRARCAEVRGSERQRVDPAGTGSRAAYSRARRRSAAARLLAAAATAETR